MYATERIYLTGDKKRVVPEGDPKAAFLFASPGDEIRDDAVKQFKLKVGEQVSETAPGRATPEPAKPDLSDADREELEALAEQIEEDRAAAAEDRKASEAAAVKASEDRAVAEKAAAEAAADLAKIEKAKKQPASDKARKPGPDKAKPPGGTKGADVDEKAGG